MGRIARPWFREFDGYWYGVVVKGTPAQKLLKASNSKANQRKAEEIFRRLTEATDPNATTDGSPCAVLVEMFLTHAEQACKPTTFRSYSDHLNYFTGHCGKVPCRELTFQHADGFLKKQAAKKRHKVTRTITVNGQERKHIVTLSPWGANMQATFIRCLKACFNWGVKTGRISNHPFGQLKATFKRSKRSVVSEATLKRLEARADEALKSLLTALRSTGCRPSEIARVTADDVHGPTWVLTEHKTDETGDPRVVWLNQVMQDLTKRLVAENPTGPIFRNSRGKPWTKNAIVIRFRNLRQELGLPKGVVAYATGRHSYITTALTNGVPTAVVAHLTGTSEKVIKRHYAHLDMGREVSQVIRFKAHDLLKATNRMTNGSGYEGLKAAMERLAGTRINTNIITGGKEILNNFGLIDRFEIVRETRDGRMQEVEVKLSDWVFNALQHNEVLTLSRDYFRLRKPIERRIYELARKHCGRQPEWRVNLALLQKKCGAVSSPREFRRLMTNIIEEDRLHAHLPDYSVDFDGDEIVIFKNRGTIARLPTPEKQEIRVAISGDGYEEARLAAPGWDVYYLEQEWRGWMTEPPQHADAAFVGFCRKWYERRGSPG